MALESDGSKRVADALNASSCLNLCKDDELLLSNIMIMEYFDDPSTNESDTESEEDGESSDDNEDDEAGDCIDCNDDGENGIGLDEDGVENEMWEEGEDIFMVEDLAGNNFHNNSAFNCLMSESDEKEMDNIRKKKCRCKQPYRGMGCSHKFADEWVFQMRCQINALTSDQKCMLMIGKISSGGVRTTEMTASSKRVNKNRKRGRTKLGYFVDGLKVCRDTFCYLHMLSDHTLTALVKHYLVNGFEVKQKKSGGAKFNSKKFSTEDHKRVVQFITNYAEVHALVIPGRVPAFKSADPRTRLLPSNVTKMKVYRLYKTELERMNSEFGKAYRRLGRSSFYQAWDNFCPYVRTTKPRTDLCWTCQRHNRAIYQSANQSEDDKRQLLQAQEEHLRIVQQERELYQRETAEAQASVAARPGDFGQHDRCSRQGSMHYSFDYAQQVFFPNDPEQPGPTFFLTARKCGVFGIHCEGLTKQVNLLIDEGVTSGKGSNSVVSYLDFYFDHYSLGEEFLQLHCDNCSGQNKNRTMMAYLCWRTINGLHKQIDIKFLVSGHTKFAPDWCFGLFKQQYRRSHVSCLEDIAQCCHRSTVKEVNVPVLAGNEAGVVYVPVRDWQSFFDNFFKTVPSIKELHHMRFDHEQPGVIFTKKYYDSEEVSHQLLKNPEVLPPAELPAVIEPAGLSAKRKKYLYEQIQQFCAQDGRQEITCPQPEDVD